MISHSIYMIDVSSWKIPRGSDHTLAALAALAPAGAEAAAAARMEERVSCVARRRGPGVKALPGGSSVGNKSPVKNVGFW